MLQGLNPTKTKRARELVNKVHGNLPPESQKGRSGFIELNGRYPAQRRPEMDKWLRLREQELMVPEISLPGTSPKDIMKDTQKC